MSRVQQTASPTRCLLVWLLASAGVALLLRLLLPQASRAVAWVGDPRLLPSTFDQVLAGLAACLLCGCLLWGWLSATFAVVEAATTWRVGPCPRLVRRVVLLSCGLALTSGLSPAHAEQGVGRPPVPDDQPSLVGLQLPDRPNASTLVDVRRTARTSARPSTTHTVRPGDTLWDIAAASLPQGADAAAIDLRWRQLWAANRAEIGPDPDLIHPDAVLRLPARRHHNEEK